MKFLRHPVRSVREPFGTAGLIVAMIALVLALTGGAYAASGGLNGKQKKEVEKIAKKYAGKPGATGPQGAAGTIGTNGKDGTNGTNGKDGTNGNPGTNGTNGKSVVVNSFGGGSEPAGEPCNLQGGSEIEVEGEGNPSYACNGEPGVIHPGETLPSEASETGEWSVSGTAHELEFLGTAISFPIPLASTLDEHHVHFIEHGETPPSGCSGTVAEPKAAKGNLCVFAVEFSNAAKNPLGKTVFGLASEGADKVGAQLKLVALEAGAVGAQGSWAVTAP